MNEPSLPSPDADLGLDDVQWDGALRAAFRQPTFPWLPPAAGRSPARGLQRYQVSGELGRGGVGVVLRARDPDLGREVALKVLSPEHASNPAMLERFLGEAQIGGQLEHPGIVPVYETGRGADERPYIAMRLIRGRTLAELLEARSGPEQDLVRLLGIFGKVCQAMAFAHARGVVHRDLKPGNVMVGGFGEVLVVDWGLAKVLAGSATPGVAPRSAEEFVPPVETVRSATPFASQAGTVLGTPAYMPPEQARGEIDTLDARSDVFALGAILCEILTGAPPYRGEHGEVLRQAHEGDLAAAGHALDRCAADRELVDLCRRCLAPERAARPGSAGEVAALLAAYEETVEVRRRAAETHAAEARIQAAQERRARRMTLALAACVVLLVLGAGGVLLSSRTQHVRRQDALDAQVRPLLQQVERHRAEARQAQQLATTADALVPVVQAWQKALATAQSTLAVAQVEHARPATRSSVEEVVRELADSTRDAEARLEQRRRDEAFSAEGDELLARWGRDDWQQSDRDFGEMFRRHGLDLDRLPEAEFLRRAQATTEPRQVAMALFAWARVRFLAGVYPGRREDLERHMRLVQALDPDPTRCEVRAVVKDGPEALPRLARMAEDPALLEEDFETVLYLGVLLHDLGDRERSVEFLEKASYRFPGAPGLSTFLAIFLTELGRFELAIRAYQAAVQLEPQVQVLWTGLGECHAWLHEWELARLAFEEAVRRDPEDPAAHAGLAATLDALGDEDGALAQYEKALAADAAWPAAVAGVADLRARRGDRSGLAADVRRAVETLWQSSAEPAVLWQAARLAELLAQHGEEDAALELLSGAAPTDVYATGMRGTLLLESGRFEEAGQELNTALRARLHPEFEEHCRAALQECRGMELLEDGAGPLAEHPGADVSAEELAAAARFLVWRGDARAVDRFEELDRRGALAPGFLDRSGDFLAARAAGALADRAEGLRSLGLTWLERGLRRLRASGGSRMEVVRWLRHPDVRALLEPPAASPNAGRARTLTDELHSYRPER